MKAQNSIHPITPVFLSLDHAAAYADVSTKTIKRWIEGGLPKYQARPRSKVLIRPNDIETFLTRKEVSPLDLNAMVEDMCKELNTS